VCIPHLQPPQVNIEIFDSGKNTYQLTVMNTLEQIITRDYVSSSNGFVNKMIDTSNLPSGIYSW
jgi:hypothetical protein